MVRPGTRNEECKILPYICMGDTVAFIANYHAGGFEIFTNDFSLPMVIARSEKGYFTPLTIDEDTPFHNFFKGLAEYLATAPSHSGYIDASWPVSPVTKPLKAPVIPGEEIINLIYVGQAYDVKSEIHTPQGGRLTTKWGQTDGYNQCIPSASYEDGTISPVRGVVGCNGVAAGQYLYHSNKYYGLPDKVPATATYNRGTNTFTFSNFTDKAWQSIDDGINPELSQSYAKLYPTSVFLGYCAASVMSKYNIGETNAYPTNTISFINKETGLSFKSGRYTDKNVKNILQAGRPVIAYSYWLDESGNRSRGHTYIIDYLNEVSTTTYDVWARWDSTSGEPRPEENSGSGTLQDFQIMFGNIEYRSTHSSQNIWLKMNWGWFGNYDEVEILSKTMEWNVGSSKWNEHYIGC